MPNLKALLPTEVEYLDNKYVFELAGSYIIVSCDSINRKVVHEISKGFSLNTPIRRFNITKDAIDLWINKFKDQGYSLIRVQNAINSLAITYQSLNEEEVEKQLIRGNSKVKIV